MHCTHPDMCIIFVRLSRTRFNRLLRNVFEAADARQKQEKKRSLCPINEYFEPVFNTAAATQIVFQQSVNGKKAEYPL